MKLKFSNIKESYLEIKDFLEYTSGVKINGLNTRIAEDLGLFGDDNYFLLIEFSKKHDVNFDKFEYEKHFESEGELFNPIRTLTAILASPLLVISKIITLIFPKVKIDLSFLIIPKMRPPN
ncbi:MAG: hypothetical protein HRT69_17530 [Flavobacteriaceae bacterium]|nr:hypothetical protein [Flavobacteriaceae bacterium]